MFLYFYIGLYGYGVRPRTGGEGVESALPAVMADRGIVPLPELADHPLAVRDDPTVDRTSSRIGLPVWYEPANGLRTPTCAAMELVTAHVKEWAAYFPESYPPIVINITDGLVTDSPYKDTDLAGWARRLTETGTREGQTLLLNAFLSPSTAPVTAFPSTADRLPAPGPELFAMSSPLPERMVSNAKSAGILVGPGARGFVFNADLEALVTFLEVGTRFDVQDETYA
jgi:hypothetical protein